LVNINDFWYTESTKSLQLSHMWLASFNKNSTVAILNLRENWTPALLLQETTIVTKRSAIQHENVN